MAFVDESVSSSSTALLNLLKVLKLSRLLRMAKLAKMYELKSDVKTSSVYNTAMLLSQMCLLTHIISCLIKFVGKCIRIAAVLSRMA